MYSVGQATNCYIVKKTKTVGTQEVIHFRCFPIEVGPWERSGVTSSFRIKPSCAAVFTKPNRFIYTCVSSEKFSAM